MLTQGLDGAEVPRQFLFTQGGMDRLMADPVQGDGIGAALAAGQQMVLIYRRAGQ